MAYRKAKEIKMRLLCERAEKEDILREQLHDKGLHTKEIEDYIQNKRMEPYRRPSGTHPIDENLKVIETLNHTTLGLPGTHKVISSTKDQYVKAQKKFDKYKTLKKIEKEEQENFEKTGVLTVKTQEFNPELQKKQQRKLAEKEHDRVIKTQNFRDHLTEMYNGMDTLNKMPKDSHYGEQFKFDNAMQELCDHQNFDHHLMQNDLKWYNEAYVKYKSTMRYTDKVPRK